MLTPLPTQNIFLAGLKSVSFFIFLSYPQGKGRECSYPQKRAKKRVKSGYKWGVGNFSKNLNAQLKIFLCLNTILNTSIVINQENITMTEIVLKQPETKLLISILSQAVKDLNSNDKKVQYSAITFFHSEQYRLILDGLGVNPDFLPVAIEALN